MLNMLGFIDQNFVTGEVTITPVGGRYVRGKWQPSELPQSTTHEATKQSASSEELRALALGGERYTHVAKFYINDGSMHRIGSTLVDQHGDTYRIVDADCRPERNYCRLMGALQNA